jgi:4-hydroxy-tetrahydrodipicolinate synthase
MTAPLFKGVITALITPLRDGNVDEAAFVKLLERQIAAGVHGVVPMGTTGESATLHLDEHKRVVELAVSVAAGRIRVIAGAGSSATDKAIEMAAHAKAVGADGALVVAPYYNRPSQAGIEAHFRQVAAATALPVMLYDIPVRTGRKISTEVIWRLVNEVQNIWAVKDAAGNAIESARLVAGAPDGFELYSGDDANTLPLLAVGAVGLIGVATHWCAPDVVELFDRWAAGDTAGACAVNARLIESWTYETGDDCPNPGPAKAMLRHLGQPAGRCRPPMDADPPWLADAAAEVHGNLMAARG